MKNKTEKQVIKLPKYKNHDNAHLYPKDYEKVDSVSLTIQSEVLSLKEIVERFSKSYPAHLERMGYYDGNSDYEDFDDVDQTRNPDFDLSDADELKGYLKEKAKRAKFEQFSKKTETIKNPEINDNSPEKI